MTVSLPRKVRDAYALLSLPPDADLKSVRRAYAGAVKLIDQETEAQAFGELRAAYETAMAWARDRAQRSPEEASATGGVEEASADQEVQSVLPAQPHDALADTAGPAEPHTATAQAQAAAVGSGQISEQKLNAWVIRITNRSQSRPGDMLVDALRDDSLVSIAAQEALEARIAAVLVNDPWQRVGLFDAAARQFRWGHHSAIRLADSRVAAWIHQACHEAVLWTGQSDDVRMRLSRTLDAILKNPVPTDQLLFRHFFAVEALLINFGQWLSLRLPRDVLQAWARACNDPDFKRPPAPKPVGQARRHPLLWLFPFLKHRPQPQSAASGSTGGKVSWRLIWMLIVAAMAALRMFGGIGGTGGGFSTGSGYGGYGNASSNYGSYGSSSSSYGSSSSSYGSGSSSYGGYGSGSSTYGGSSPSYLTPTPSLDSQFRLPLNISNGSTQQ